MPLFKHEKIWTYPSQSTWVLTFRSNTPDEATDAGARARELWDDEKRAEEGANELARLAQEHNLQPPEEYDRVLTAVKVWAADRPFEDKPNATLDAASGKITIYEPPTDPVVYHWSPSTEAEWSDMAFEERWPGYQEWYDGPH